MAEASREIIRQLPYLRRYARAITGSQIRGDQYIRVALETIVQEPERIKADANIKLQLFRLFHEVWRIVDSTIRQGDGATGGHPIEAQLEALPPLERQALLLVALERFSIEQAADILRTAVAPTWQDIGQLAAIAVLRTGLNYSLEREIAREEERVIHH